MTFKLGLAVPLALLLAVAMPSASGFAGDDEDGVWNPVSGQSNSDGSTDETFQKDDDKYSFAQVHTDGDGNVTITFYRTDGGTGPGFPNSNPGPDGTTQRIDKPDVAGMLKKAKGLTIQIFGSLKEGTPLAGWLESEGRGGSIRWNPSDDSDKGGPGQPPKNNTGGLTPKQLAEIAKLVNFTAKSLAAIGNSMGDGVDGLAGESAPTPNKNNGSSGRGKGTSDGSGSSDNKYKNRGGGEAATLGPRPDLVNPAPKSKTGGSSNLFAPGLLDTNTGLPGSGPAATGTPSRGIAPGTNLR